MCVIIDEEYFKVMRVFKEERNATTNGRFRWPDSDAPNTPENMEKYNFQYIDGILFAERKQTKIGKEKGDRWKWGK